LIFNFFWIYTCSRPVFLVLLSRPSHTFFLKSRRTYGRAGKGEGNNCKKKKKQNFRIL
jgi:hypothetical protein